MYVDTSTLIKLLIDEDGSERAKEVWLAADGRTAAMTMLVEARAALAAAERARRLTPAGHVQAKADLDAICRVMWLSPVTSGLVATACDLAEAERLRGYDAIHLAAALQTGATHLTSADDDLCDAAQRCGLAVLNPLDA